MRFHTVPRLAALVAATIVASAAYAVATPVPSAIASAERHAWWPAWRGGAAEGRVDRDLPTHWTASEGIRWKTALPGRGHSSPIVFGDRLYVTTADVEPSGQRLDAGLRVASLGLLVVVAALVLERVVARGGVERRASLTDLAWGSAAGAAMLAMAVVITAGDALLDFARCNIRGWLAGVVFVAMALWLAAGAIEPGRWRRVLGLVAIAFAAFAMIAFPSKDYAFRGGIGAVRMQISLAICALPLALGAVLVSARARHVPGRWLARGLGAAAAIATLVPGALLVYHLAVFRDGAFPEKVYAPRVGLAWLAVPVAAGLLVWARGRRRAGSLALDVALVGLGALSIAVVGVMAVERLAVHSVYLSYQIDEPRLALAVSSRAVWGAAALFVLGGAWILARARASAAPARGGRYALALLAPLLAALVFVRTNYVSIEPVLVRSIVCVDRASGAIRWALSGLEGPQSPIDGRNTAATPTPVTDGRRVCAYFGTPGLMCADADGRLAWARRDLGYDGIYGVGFSPVLADGLLIVASERPDARAEVHALDVSTGETRWRRTFATVATATGNNRTPIVREVAGTKVVVLWGLTYVTGLALGTGEPAWTHTIRSGGDLVSSAVSDGERLFLSDLEGTTALQLDGLAAGRPQVRWTSPARANCASPVVVNGILFTVTDGGIASASAAETGVLLWRRRLPGQYYASLVASPTAVYFTNSEGVTSVVAAAPAFQLLGRNDLGEETMASMASADGELYIRSAGGLYAVAATKTLAN